MSNFSHAMSNSHSQSTFLDCKVDQSEALLRWVTNWEQSDNMLFFSSLRKSRKSNATSNVMGRHVDFGILLGRTLDPQIN